MITNNAFVDKLFTTSLGSVIYPPGFAAALLIPWSCILFVIHFNYRGHIYN